MKGGHRVAWIRRSKVYHLARYRYTESGRDVWVYAPCGVVLTSPGYRHNEGSEAQAQSLRLRPCARCPLTAPV